MAIFPSIFPRISISKKLSKRLSDHLSSCDTTIYPQHSPPLWPIMADLPPLTPNETRSSIYSMHNVDPSPVDDDDEEANTQEAFSTTDPSHPSYDRHDATSSHNTTNFLGLTPSRTIHILSTIQKLSLAPFGIYLTMHYTNTALIPLITPSVRAADSYLLLTRPYYQSAPLEPLLIFIPVLTHVISGVSLRLYRRRLTALRHGAETHKQRRELKKRIPFPKLSLTSAAGYVLYPMFVLHMLSMRITPKKIDGSSASVGLRYFAHGISSHPVVGVATHAFLIATASYHFISGGAKFMKLSREYVTEGGEDGCVKRMWRGRIVNGIAATMAGVWMAGALGVVGLSGKGVGWEANHWDAIFKQVPLVGRLF